MVDRQFGGCGVDFCKSLCSFYDIFLLSSPSFIEINKSSLLSGGDQVVMGLDIDDKFVVLMNCSLWISSPGNRRYNSEKQAHSKNSFRKGSPRHKFLSFFSSPPRSCSVSVSCRWTVPKANDYKRWFVLILRSGSCFCGIKRAALSHCSWKESPSHHQVACCWIFLVVLMILIKNQRRKYEDRRKKIEEEEEEEEEEIEEEVEDVDEEEAEEEEEKVDNYHLSILIIIAIYFPLLCCFFTCTKICNRIVHILADKAKPM